MELKSNLSLFDKVIKIGTAVSAEFIPAGAESNRFNLSPLECGAWSVAIISMIPLLTASINAILSLSSRNGGLTLVFVS